VERFHAVGEKALCIHGIVAEKLPRRAVVFIRTGARDDVWWPSRVVPPAWTKPGVMLIRFEILGRIRAE
jgi:hypothetical protein